MLEFDYYSDSLRQIVYRRCNAVSHYLFFDDKVKVVQE